MSVTTSTPSSSVVGWQPCTHIHSCLFPEPWYVIPSQSREVQIFKTQISSPDSPGHTLVAYMPRLSWPLHRHKGTNYLIKTWAFEASFLNTHAHTHTHTALLTGVTGHRTVQHAAYENLCLSRGRCVCMILSWGLFIWKYDMHDWSCLEMVNHWCHFLVAKINALGFYNSFYY